MDEKSNAYVEQVAKLSDKPVEKGDLIEFLKSHDDFQFELDVFRLCLAGGAMVEHGGIYRDPVTRKDRQFDIRMLVRRGQLLVRLAIECKNLKTNHPLLVSRIPRRAEENFHEIILSYRRSSQSVLSGEPSTEEIRVVGPAGIFETGKLVGKSTAQVGRTPNGDLITGDAEVYEKWAQALASAFDLVAESTDDYRLTATPAAATVVIPILVVADGTLWTVDYSADGVALADPTTADKCEIFLGKEINTGVMGVSYTFSHLLVFTKSSFNGYLDRLMTNELYWDPYLPTPGSDRYSNYQKGRLRVLFCTLRKSSAVVPGAKRGIPSGSVAARQASDRRKSVRLADV